MQHHDVLHLALVKYYDNPKIFEDTPLKVLIGPFFRRNELNMSWKTPCLRMNNANFAIYVIYYTKYSDIFQNKMAFTDCKTCQFIKFSKTKFSKTAGLWRCQQVNLDFL